MHPWNWQSHQRAKTLSSRCVCQTVKSCCFHFLVYVKRFADKHFVRNLTFCKIPLTFLSAAAVFVTSFILLGFSIGSALVTMVTVAMIVIDLMGIMYYWNITFNAVSLVNLVMVSGQGLASRAVCHSPSMNSTAWQSFKAISWCHLLFVWGCGIALCPLPLCFNCTAWESHSDSRQACENTYQMTHSLSPAMYWLLVSAVMFLSFFIILILNCTAFSDVSNALFCEKDEIYRHCRSFIKGKHSGLDAENSEREQSLTADIGGEEQSLERPAIYKRDRKNFAERKRKALTGDFESLLLAM